MVLCILCTRNTETSINNITVCRAVKHQSYYYKLTTRYVATFCPLK